jgi:UDP-N-acetyl-D-mannosaminuronate dehydrogenase
MKAPETTHLVSSRVPIEVNNSKIPHICIIGSGYVGLTYAAGLSLKGFNVFLVDIDQSRVNMIEQGICPIDEPIIQM